jgi:hypothetical protein
MYFGISKNEKSKNTGMCLFCLFNTTGAGLGLLPVYSVDRLVLVKHFFGLEIHYLLFVIEVTQSHTIDFSFIICQSSKNNYNIINFG